MNKDVLARRYEAYREYKQQGHTMKEVAAHFGISKGTAQAVCRGIAPQRGNGPARKTKSKDDDNVKAFIADRVPLFEYVGGYTNSDGGVLLRCKVCGHVQQRSMVSVRHRSTICDNCKRMAVIDKAAREEREKQERREARRLKKEERDRAKASARAEWEQSRLHSCPVCGGPTIRAKYCSPGCARRAANNMHEAQRRAKVRAALVDADIELHTLYNRDGGECYICGGACDWTDFQETEGTIVCGGDYPSIDHVLPLSKGGEHSWENVRLAHRRCNTEKRDRIIPSPVTTF